MQNIGIATKNKTGLMGVTYYPKRNRFKSNIILNKKYIHIGYFATAELAHEAYLNKKREIHPFSTI